MNISQSTLSALTELGYIYSLDDEKFNTTAPEKATGLNISWLRSGNEIEYIGKSIKATKKETTLDYILSKINSDNVYKNFSQYFKGLLNNESLNCYPTSYGIGIFVAISYRNSAQNTKNEVEAKLNSLGIKYTTEYSDAGWVFRYKISKSAENIALINSIINKPA